MAAVALPPPTVRVRLARLAAEAIEADPQLTPNAGPDGRWRTFDEGSPPLAGVVAAAADRAGRVELMLHVGAVWPFGPLDQVADGLRRQVVRAATDAGLLDSLGPIAVWIDDVVDPLAPVTA